MTADGVIEGLIAEATTGQPDKKVRSCGLLNDEVEGDGEDDNRCLPKSELKEKLYVKARGGGDS